MITFSCIVFNLLFSEQVDIMMICFCRIGGASSDVNPSIYKPEALLSPRDPPRDDDGKLYYLFSPLVISYLSAMMIDDVVYLQQQRTVSADPHFS